MKQKSPIKSNCRSCSDTHRLNARSVKFIQPKFTSQTNLAWRLDIQRYKICNPFILWCIGPHTCTSHQPAAVPAKYCNSPTKIPRTMLGVHSNITYHIRGNLEGPKIKNIVLRIFWTNPSFSKWLLLHCKRAKWRKQHVMQIKKIKTWHLRHLVVYQSADSRGFEVISIKSCGRGFYANWWVLAIKGLHTVAGCLRKPIFEKLWVAASCTTPSPACPPR